MTANLLRFIVITKTISHYFSQFIYNYSLVFKEPVVLEKCIMATLPVYLRYQFKLYPFLALYTTVLYWQSGDSFGIFWNRLSDPTSLKLQWIQRAGLFNIVKIKSMLLLLLSLYPLPPSCDNEVVRAWQKSRFKCEYVPEVLCKQCITFLMFKNRQKFGPSFCSYFRLFLAKNLLGRVIFCAVHLKDTLFIMKRIRLKLTVKSWLINIQRLH